MKQEGVVSFSFWCHAIAIAGIGFLVRRIPVLWIRWVGNHSIQIQRVIRLSDIIVHRPVLLQCIATASEDIGWIDAAHNKIHTGQIVCVFLQLLRIVHDAVFILQVLGSTFAYGDQKRARTARRIIYFDFLTILQVICDNLRHKLRHFMRRIKLTGLLPSICSKVADQIFVNKA